MKPAISVVMGVYNGADQLADTIESVLGQSYGDFEFIIVDDGSTDRNVRLLLEAYQNRDARIRVITKVNQGLTAALIDGCASVQGGYIARIDAGDRMTEDRLRLQVQVLDQFPQCVLVSCYTEFHGPCWEPLWVNKGTCASGQPLTALPDNPEMGLLVDITHHGSAMFRRSAYERAGGYRLAFYYGQDWDLWYRLAELGDFCVLPQVLYQARFFPGAISMRNAERQRAIAQCSKGAFVARRVGQDETAWLDKAATIRPASTSGHSRKADAEPGYYFIGEALRRSGDFRCIMYFWWAVKANPLKLRSYTRLVQSLLIKRWLLRRSGTNNNSE